MELPHIIMWAVVLAVGVPSAWRNPTAGALVLCWVVSEGIYALTGNGLAVAYYFYPDIFVICVIMAKHGPYSCPPDGNTERHLRSVLVNRTIQDYVILLIFPVMWVLYVVDLHPFYKWWSLWLLAIIQFFLAGWEAIVIQRHAAEHASRKPKPPFGFELLWGGRRVSANGP